MNLRLADSDLVNKSEYFLNYDNKQDNLFFIVCADLSVGFSTNINV